MHKLEESGTFKIHTVLDGETIHSIAEKLNVRVEDLKHWNNLTNNSIKKGQKLKYVSDVSE
ncbi:MAG: LysM peptidoglycan-binding domain-containing protein [Bacteroidetes bacterium]|nr:LysM peptidoglycan-binding domain-containing protein [Bacteroidota bacterium]